MVPSRLHPLAQHRLPPPFESHIDERTSLRCEHSSTETSGCMQSCPRHFEEYVHTFVAAIQKDHLLTTENGEVEQKRCEHCMAPKGCRSNVARRYFKHDHAARPETLLHKSSSCRHPQSHLCKSKVGVTTSHERAWHRLLHQVKKTLRCSSIQQRTSGARARRSSTILQRFAKHCLARATRMR